MNGTLFLRTFAWNSISIEQRSNWYSLHTYTFSTGRSKKVILGWTKVSRTVCAVRYCSGGSVSYYANSSRGRPFFWSSQRPDRWIDGECYEREVGWLRKCYTRHSNWRGVLGARSACIKRATTHHRKRLEIGVRGWISSIFSRSLSS